MARGTSWEKVSDWYDDIVGSEGHYYHREVIFPRLLPLLKKSKNLLDCACGQGVLAKQLGKETEYVGIDLSKELIDKAKAGTRGSFKVVDITKPFDLEKSFDTIVILLAFQNLEDPKGFIENAKKHLIQGGRLIMVLNHPCFRIPRQSGWEVNEAQKLQMRTINRYMSPLEIPLQANPSRGKNSEILRTFHKPLSEITKLLTDAKLVITSLEEWSSNKTSTGKNAKMENRAREEFPLFLTLVARK
ncbi:MAG: class I SAM-dependent methyltransferase [Simkaniaceae bacterium]|nr:class I SAM-dependent methyltransferase [Simkaniaceae bacterium]